MSPARPPRRCPPRQRHPPPRGRASTAPGG
jgi:hypothetical protein